MATLLSTIQEFNLNDQAWEFWFGGISLIAGLIALLLNVWFYLKSKQKKCFAYEVISDAGLVNSYKDLGENIQVLLDGREVDDVRLLVIKISNTGNIPIKLEDYDQPIRFYFPYHDVLKCSIQDTRLVLPGKEKKMLSLNEVENFVELNPPVLNARDEFNIKIFTRGIERDVASNTKDRAHIQQKGKKVSTTPGKVEMSTWGHITGGEIVETIPRASLMTSRNLLVGISIFLVGLLILPIVGLITAFTQGNCAFGTLKVGGSSAFYERVMSEAQDYRTGCPVAIIDVQEDSSASGVRDLQTGRIQIATSEIPMRDVPGSDIHQLKEHRAVGIVFAVILNDKVLNVPDLSTEQIKNIYNGTYQNWSEIGGPDLPITVVSRQQTSGTYATFVKHVLGGQEPALPASAVKVDTTSQVVNEVEKTRGAIGYVDLGRAAKSAAKIVAIDNISPNPGTVMNGKYRFWAVEYLYTLATPDALTMSFVAYLQNRLVTSDTFVAIDAIGKEVLMKQN